MSLFLQNNPKIKSLTNVEPEKSEKPNTEVQMNAHMASQKKKVMIKRETDKSFAFIKVETQIKPESRLSKYPEIKQISLTMYQLYRDAQDA